MANRAYAHTSFQGQASAPAEDAKDVTPSDGSDLPSGPCRALMLDVAGVVKFTTFDGTTLTRTLQAGVTSIRMTRVWETGTDAGLQITALY